MRIFGLIFVVAISLGCDETTIAFENQVPSARVRDIKITIKTHSYASPKPLLPGEISSPVNIVYDEQGKSGVVSFTLEKEGQLIHLEAVKRFKVDGEAVFTLTPDTEVRSYILEAPMALWAAE